MLWRLRHLQGEHPACSSSPRKWRFSFEVVQIRGALSQRWSGRHLLPQRKGPRRPGRRCPPCGWLSASYTDQGLPPPAVSMVGRRMPALLHLPRLSFPLAARPPASCSFRHLTRLARKGADPLGFDFVEHHKAPFLACSPFFAVPPSFHVPSTKPSLVS